MLQIYDYAQMFDSINLEQAISDVYEAGLNDDNLSLLYKANKEIHMGEFPEPQQKYAAARENWDVGPSQEGPLMLAINSSQIFLENPDI